MVEYGNQYWKLRNPNNLNLRKSQFKKGHKPTHTGRNLTLEQRQKIAKKLKGTIPWWIKSNINHPMKNKHNRYKLSETRKAMFRKGLLKPFNGNENPAKREDVKEKIRFYRMKQKFPTSKTVPEKIFLNLCKKYKLPFSYVGDGNFWIGNVNPDFVNCNGNKIVVEVWGNYWHNLKKEKIKDVKRLKTLKSFGWSRIVFWENELKSLKNDIDERKLLKRLSIDQTIHERSQKQQI